MWQNENVIGTVLVSQSTYRILKSLYDVRLDIFKIFLISVFAAIILSFLLSITIASPLKKLKLKAEAILDHKGKVKVFNNSKAGSNFVVYLPLK